MKYEIISFLLIIFTVLGSGFAQRICGQHQVYARCADTCRVSCDNYRQPSRPCILLCREGCDCIEGYLWYGERCVPMRDCARLVDRYVCPHNKTYRSTDIIIRTCDNLELHPVAPGCYCDERYVWDRIGGRCVSRKDCPKDIICPFNEEINDCASPCPRTCKNPNPEPCDPFNCVTQCVCKWPLVRNTVTGICVKSSKCSPPVCTGENEEHIKCGSRCPPSCNERNTICDDVCVPGCFCKFGYVRLHKGGPCVPISRCNVKY